MGRRGCYLLTVLYIEKVNIYREVQQATSIFPAMCRGCAATGELVVVSECRLNYPLANYNSGQNLLRLVGESEPIFQ